MDVISEIKMHLARADGDQKIVSVHRWEAARLIWETVMAGWSRREIAEKIGKSHTHVRYMYNCWDMVGRKLTVSGPEDLPDFNEIYNSEEVRGIQRQEQPQAAESQERRQPREQTGPDNTAQGLVEQARQAIRSLHDNPGFDVGLSREEACRLNDLIPMIRAILGRIARLARSALLR